MGIELSRVDSGIVFRTGRGGDVQGKVVQFTPDSLVFEVYSPYRDVEAGETLDQMILYCDGRPVMSGGAIVNGVLATGVLFIVTATPLGPWKPFPELDAPGRLFADAHSLVDDWASRDTLLPEYQLAVTAIRGFLTELRQFTAPVDLAFGVRSNGPTTQPPDEMIETLFRVVQPRLKGLFDRFEEAARMVPPEHVAAHRAFTQRELHPLTLCSPFVHRTFSKPLGYPGDYEMVNMILNSRPAGPSTYAKLVDAYFVRLDVAQAHRNRIDELVDILQREARRVGRLERPLRILSLGCGPASEVCRFIREEPLSRHCELTLLDYNDQTLAYARAQIARAMRESGREPALTFVNSSVQQLVREAVRAEADRTAAYDVVYCAGLLDYLADRMCTRLMELMCRWVAPGGVAVVTNVHPRHQSHAALDCLGEWRLNVRTETDLLALAPEDAGAVAVATEPLGINVFLDVRKPDEGHDSRLRTERCHAST